MLLFNLAVNFAITKQELSVLCLSEPPPLLSCFICGASAIFYLGQKNLKNVMNIITSKSYKEQTQSPKAMQAFLEPEKKKS